MAWHLCACPSCSVNTMQSLLPCTTLLFLLHQTPPSTSPKPVANQFWTDRLRPLTQLLASMSFRQPTAAVFQKLWHKKLNASPFAYIKPTVSFIIEPCTITCSRSAHGQVPSLQPTSQMPTYISKDPTTWHPDPPRFLLASGPCTGRDQ